MSDKPIENIERRKKREKPLSWFINRIGIMILVYSFCYNAYMCFITKEKLEVQDVLMIIGGFGMVVATPNKSVDKMIAKNKPIEYNREDE